MSTTSLTYTINAAELTLSSGGIIRRTMGPIVGLSMADLKNRDPVAWAVIEEFNDNATASGTVTVTAVA